MDEEIRRCPLCNNEFDKVDGIYISFSGLCRDCAKATYIVWKDIVAPDEKKDKMCNNADLLKMKLIKRIVNYKHDTKVFNAWKLDLINALKADLDNYK